MNLGLRENAPINDMAAESQVGCINYELKNTRESNRLKYRSGSGSRNLIFNGSVPVQIQDFLKIWFRFGSGSVAPKFKGSGSVQVQ